MIAIRLTRKGTKKKPVYRVVVAEKTAPRDGRFIEILGHYNPIPEPPECVLDLERVNHWLGKGAKPSDTVRRLIDKAAASPKSN